MISTATLLLLIPFALCAIVAYLLGSVNTAIIVTKIATKGGNIKEMGSGNAGFTNVLRCVGKAPAIITIVCDFCKAIVSVLLSRLIMVIALSILVGATGSAMYDIYFAGFVEMGGYIAGVACIIGHMFPIYFRFKGGKGVVAAVGMILILDWRVFLIILGLFGIVFLISKIISVSSLICALLYGPITFLVTYYFDHILGGTVGIIYVWFVAIVASIAGISVVIKHHENIGRIFRGEEKKITAKKNVDESK